MPDVPCDPKNAPIFSWSRLLGSPWAGALLVALAASLILGPDLATEPHFMDESAYYSQSYYAEIFLNGRRDDPAWLEFPAYDLPPLPKYLIGAALAFGGFKTPGPSDARDWYGNALLRFDPPGALAFARFPFLFLGVIGCIAIYGLGVQIGGRGVGLLAAGFLMANPLYSSHSRRAMSDVPCEAFLLLSLLLSLSGWKRTFEKPSNSGKTATMMVFVSVMGGLAVGLSVLSKLSGSLALMISAAWVVLSWSIHGAIKRKAAFTLAMALMAACSALIFVALDPYLTAHPVQVLPEPIAEIRRLGLVERAFKMAALRVEMADGQRIKNQHNAMNSAYDKITTTAVQGFGRFGPFGPRADDSTIRYDFAQDRGGMIWLPWVLAGAIWAWFAGREQSKSGEPPTAWALLIYFIVSLTVVTTYLPLAWNRYFLPIQAPSALLAASAAVAIVSRIYDRRLRVEVEG